jgi:N-methylhydantoinase A
MAGKRLAIDVGGTFIDFVLLDETTGKIAVDKESSEAGKHTDHLLKDINRFGVKVSDLEMIIHGSTVVINTILQERGGKTGLITTQGFRDVLELGRGNRPEVFNLLYKPIKPLVPRYLRFEVPERVDHKGQVIQPLNEDATRKVVERLKGLKVDSIAVCFLHSYSNPIHERRVGEIIKEMYPEVSISLSSDVTGEFREFERTSTAVLNAYVMPRMSSYLGDLESRLVKTGFTGSLNIIQSTGGMMASTEARTLPIRTLESGPAGGIIGAVALGKQAGYSNLIAADVGGTSFDVALILKGRPFEKSETYVNKRPVLQPTIDIISIGAGGGSIAWIDREGGFRVGPLSAEAQPGPVCFARGGTEPTVTDAHLVLGRINPDYFLGSRMKLDIEAAKKAITKKLAEPLGLSLSEAAFGITHIADTNMINAIRQVTIERGYDPREFSLLCYGGGGGLFAGSLTQELKMRNALVPINPAVFSAWGILNSDYRDDMVRTAVKPTADISASALLGIFNELAEASVGKLKRNGFARSDVTFFRSIDMRYEGQEHTVKVPLPPDEELVQQGIEMLVRRFDQLHELAYAHSSPGTPTQIVNIRLSAIVEAKKPVLPAIPKGSGQGKAALKNHRKVYFRRTDGEVNCPTYDRKLLLAGDRISGPAVIEEWSTTIIVHPGQHLIVDDYGNLVISEEGA